MNIQEENRYGKFYSDYEDKLILLMNKQQKSCAEIAALGHGRTAKSVALRLRKLLNGIKKKSSNVSDSEAAQIVKLHFEGKHSNEIVHITGRSDRTVARITRLADVVKQIIDQGGNENRDRTH